MNKKIALITVIAASISSAHAGGFGAGFAGGVVGGLVEKGIEAAANAGQQPRTIVVEKQVVIHEHHTAHHTASKPAPTPIVTAQQAPQKIDNPIDLPADLLPLISSKDAVLTYLEKFFKDTNPNVTLADSSLFIEVQIGAYHYLIAKVSVNTPYGSTDRGFVIDIKNKYSATLSPDHYHEFLQTGNINLLGEHPLDPLG